MAWSVASAARLSAAWSSSAAGPRAIGASSSSTTGITSRTDEEVNASSAPASSPSGYAPSSTAYPRRRASSIIAARVTPARMPSSSEGV